MGHACVRGFSPLCVRACVHTHRPSFVCWTCPRVLVGSTWNLFRSTIYELKLCTSYFRSASVRPFVCERRRNLGPHSTWQFPVIFSNVLSWTPPTVLVGSIWNLYRLNIYGLKLYTSPWGDVGLSVCLWEVSELRSKKHFTNPSDFFSNVLSWTCPGVLFGSIWNLYRLNICGLKLCTSP